MTMLKGARYPGRFYQNAFHASGESEGSGCSGRVDTEMTASEDSSTPVKKCISLNSDKHNAFGIPTQVISVSNTTQFEKKDLVHKLKMELEQVRAFQKRVGLYSKNGVTVSSSSDIIIGSNGQYGVQNGNYLKPSAFAPGQVKKVNSSGHKVRGWKRGSSGRFETVNQVSKPTTGNAVLIKQCGTLLDRLMSHQYGWVFKTPVDAVKLNIPDYYTVIKNPMDLGTVKSKITSGAYQSPLEFAADVRLTFDNAMTYNPPGNDVHIMADTLKKYFEVRWKNIEKKLPATDPQPLPEKSGPHNEFRSVKPVPPSKKRKVSSMQNEVVPESVKCVMTDKEKHKLSRELESTLGEMPAHIIDFLREHCSDGKDSGEDEIEIDIDNLSDDTLYTLRKLLDDYFLEKLKNQEKAEPCEIELFESGLSNSSMQHCKGNEQAEEDVDIGGNEPPVSSYSGKMGQDTTPKSKKCISSGSSSDSDSGASDSESDDVKTSRPVNNSKEQDALNSGAQVDEKYNDDDYFDRNRTGSGLDLHEETLHQRPSPVTTDSQQDGNSSPTDKRISPEKHYRAALLKNRFADTILKAQEKTLAQGGKADPEKVHREREKLEIQRKKEKARLQAEAKAAEEARRQAQAEAAAEAKQKRELERAAARQALLKMEKTVEINENSRFLEDLEMLRSGPAEQLPSSVDETSPEHSQDGLGGFKFGGGNPLEQLGLYMKEDEEEEEGDPPVPEPVNDAEEGEID